MTENQLRKVNADLIKAAEQAARVLAVAATGFAEIGLASANKVSFALLQEERDLRAAIAKAEGEQ